MLLANETVAEEYYLAGNSRSCTGRMRRRMRRKSAALATFINNFGYSMHIGNQVRCVRKRSRSCWQRWKERPQEPLIIQTGAYDP